MSVGSIGRGVTSLLSGLGGVGPQGPAAPRPPVQSVPGLPSQPSFQDRYQRDSFEQSGQGRGKGPNLSGGEQQQGSSSFGPQARPSEDPTAELLKDAERRRLKFKPADVMEFPKGGTPRQRPQRQQQEAGGEPQDQQPRQQQEARPDPQPQPQQPKGKPKPPKKPQPKPAKPIVRRPPTPLMSARPSQAKPQDAGPTFRPRSAASSAVAQAAGSSGGGMEFRPAAERRVDAPVSARDSGPVEDHAASPGLAQGPLPSLFDKHDIGNKAQGDAQTAKMMVALAQRI
jgi:hypothetical protein